MDHADIVSACGGGVAHGVREQLAADFDRLELHTNPFLKKQMQLLIECIDDLQQESYKLQHHERNVQRQKAAQQQFLLKRKTDAAGRQQEALTEEELASNPLFKPIPQPSRVRNWACASVSIPSATSSRPRLRATAMIARTIAASSDTYDRWRTNSWSIFRRSIGKARR